MYIIKILKFIFKKISASPPTPNEVGYSLQIMGIPWRGSLQVKNHENSIAKRAHLTLESLEIPGRSVIQMRSVIHLSLNRVKV
jgi:hypothetical protein